MNPSRSLVAKLELLDKVQVKPTGCDARCYGGASGAGSGARGRANTPATPRTPPRAPSAKLHHHDHDHHADGSVADTVPDN